jgi:protein TonB
MYSQKSTRIVRDHHGNLPRLLLCSYSGNMDLRCFLFTSDEGSAETIGQVLAALEVEVEFCPDAIAAAETIAHQPFHIVIIDWDNQPEAGLLLSTARERKASERPITLAIVSNDASVPKALQAGANSILRKPIVETQIKDTLTTARDLLRARLEPSPAAISARATAAAAAAAPAPLPRMEQKTENTLRTGEFLQSGPTTPSGSFVTESDIPASLEQSSDGPVDPLKDLEPVAASVAQQAPPVPSAIPATNEPRGLEWYLKNRGISHQAPPPAPPSAAPEVPPSAKPELIGYDQPPSSAKQPAPQEPQPADHEKKKEAELFAYIDGDRPEEDSPRTGFRMGKGAIFVAFLLASIAVAAAPQAPWHPAARALWSRGQRSLHAWLNPQPVTTAPTPAAHETFQRPGDEYKLPTAEAIPDATTDPSQIQVLPVVDPTAKKPNPDAANPDQPVVQPGQPAVSADPSQSAPIQVKENAPPQSVPDPAAVAPSTQPPAKTDPVVTAPAVTDKPAPAPSTPDPSPAPRVQPPPPRQPSIPGDIPQSLRSQMAPNTPDPGGFRRPDTAMPSIEPVVVPESVERPLLIDQPPLHYPSSAKGQQGTVILQVLIGRDGTVQDTKFLQGSLAFARTAIDGVRLWKFKPYTMNGRPVSVQTTLSITLKPGS